MMELLIADWGVARTSEVCGAIETRVAGGAAELAVGMGRGVGDEQVEARVTLEGLLPAAFLVESGAARSNMTGDAAIMEMSLALVMTKYLVLI